jgi:hypothetical protein
VWGGGRLLPRVNEVERRVVCGGVLKCKGHFVCVGELVVGNKMNANAQHLTPAALSLYCPVLPGSWGEEGYFKLEIGVGKGGLCGIATTASYPVKEHDNPRVPLMCDPFGWSECAAGSTCSCNWPFFFNLFCIRCGYRACVVCPDGLMGCGLS